MPDNAQAWKDQATTRKMGRLQPEKSEEFRYRAYDMYLKNVLPPEIARIFSAELGRPIAVKAVYRMLKKHFEAIRKERDPATDAQRYSDEQGLVAGKALKAAGKLEDGGNEESPQYAALLNTASVAFERRAKAQGLLQRQQDVHVQVDLGAMITQALEKRRQPLLEAPIDAEFTTVREVREDLAE